ncbi:MAG TPA: hypothetical protein VHH73_17885, partial [Verrucomicrobiae bacterium]|nr:hypothetical protein [Verrucomicrobiae bacterium]
YLQRAFQATRQRAVKIINRRRDAAVPVAEMADANLIIVADPLSNASTTALRDQWQAGKTVLVTLKSVAVAPVLGALLGGNPPVVTEAADSRYGMLGQIDFTHPFFAPFADPRFSDFTKIHFWKHRHFETNQLSGARVIARFDEGDPALIEIRAGKGLLLVLTSGWQPADSQFALSSKFVPLLYAMLEVGGDSREQARPYFIGDEVALTAKAGETLTIRKPDNSEVKVPADARFTQTDQPGLYTVTGGAKPYRFAVNLSSEESRTGSLALEELSRLGVPLHHTEPEVTSADAKTRHEHLQAAELENRQKLWRWLLVVVVSVLFLETGLAGWLARRVSAPIESQS